MVNHYSKFLKCLAYLSAPLNNLLKKEVPWEWTEQHQTCFEKIKQSLTTTTVLAHFDPDIPIGQFHVSENILINCLIAFT